MLKTLISCSNLGFLSVFLIICSTSLYVSHEHSVIMWPLPYVCLLSSLTSTMPAYYVFIPRNLWLFPLISTILYFESRIYVILLPYSCLCYICFVQLWYFPLVSIPLMESLIPCDWYTLFPTDFQPLNIFLPYFVVDCVVKLILRHFP